MGLAIVLVFFAGVAAVAYVVVSKERRAKQSVLSLQGEYEQLLEQLTGVQKLYQWSGSAVDASLDFADETLRLADVALAQVRYTQAVLYIGLARLALAWGNFVGAYPDADDFRNTRTNRLIFGLTLLRKNKLEAAHDELSKVWLEENVCAMTHMVALQAHIWVLERQGNFEDAQEEQQLLLQMQRELTTPGDDQE